MNSMNYIGKFINNFRDFYNEINAATLTGAIDVIVVEHEDGSFTCSPFHVRFGKLGVLRSREKIVDIEINGEPLDIHMKLGDSGEAFFVEEVSQDELGEDKTVPLHLACSPIPQDNFLPHYHINSADPEPTYSWPEPKVITAGSSAPKTFCPETLREEDQTRRLAPEFRPIVPLEPEPAPEEPEESSSGTQRDIVGEEQPRPAGTGGKRKRRRKSVMKKKGNQKRGTGSQPEPSETKDAVFKTQTKDQDEPIFQLEDVQAQQECNSHLGGIMTTNTEGTLYTSAECTTCLSAPMGVTLCDNSLELARIQHASTETDFHFFSDTEITPGCSPNDSRPSTPVQSDTEFEMNRQSKAVSTEDDEDGDKSGSGQLQQSWRWGELPSPPRPVLTSQTSRSAVKSESAQPEPVSSSDEEATKKLQDAAAAEAAQRSMLSGMFSFMKKTKRIRHHPESEGIYLSDLNADELDPEVAALYFPTSYRQGHSSAAVEPAELHDEEDAESGNGTSLPQSPHSVEGAIGGPKSLDSDFDELKHSVFEKKSYGEISMSLCGGLTENNGPTEDTFLQSLVNYDDVATNPKLIDNPNLVVRLNGKYYNWRTACPLVMSLVLYQRPLPQAAIDTLASEYMPLKKGTSERGYSSWFYWRRTSEPKKMATAEQSSPELEGVKESPMTPEEDEEEDVAQKSELMEDVQDVARSQGVTIPRPTSLDMLAETGVATQTSLPASPVISTIPKDSKEEGYSGSNSSDESDTGRTKIGTAKLPLERRSYYEHVEQYRKTLRLSSDQIASLNLKEGANEVVFSVTTAYQGTSRCKCHVYRWRYDDKVVISDIDGTITKSDVLGHILPIVGKDWAQSGVAQLFTKIKNNGYKLLYLSARAIGQARVTREYLRSIKQGDLSLPDGPLLLNPTSLISAFHREVIEKKPEEFKISCLRDIQALFPASSKPFYAGYGNKVNDVWAYRAVGIPIFRIFTINHRGELKHELTQTFQSSYSNMSYIVDQMFPPPPEDTSEEFTNFVYWRDPIPEIVMDVQFDHEPVADNKTAVVAVKP